jgi:FixJ family two-component response regulator
MDDVLDLQPRTAAIAIVDDDASVRRSLTNLFASLGWPVEAFTTGEEFLASDFTATNCVVLDVELPGMSGLELLERLVRAGSGIGVVMVTAHADQQTRRRATELGATAFLAKPFRSDELVRTVRQRLELRS